MKTVKVEKVNEIYRESGELDFYTFNITLSNGTVQTVEYDVYYRGGTLEEIVEELEDINWRELIEWCLWDTWLEGGNIEDHEKEEAICESIMDKFDSKQPLEKRELSLLNGLMRDVTVFGNFDYSTWVLQK